MATNLMATTEKQHQAVVEKIDENTRVSVEAFKEANDVNRKIADLGLTLREPDKP